VPAAKAPQAAPVQTAALAPQAAAPQAAKVKGGKYKVHVAAVRSRAEAEALAQRLNAQYGQALASRTATVDEATIGSMGKFYRVRVGSYATAEEPRGLCNTLRNSGYDCLVVTN
jgi:cell division septation protein DedD